MDAAESHQVALEYAKTAGRLLIWQIVLSLVDILHLVVPLVTPFTDDGTSVSEVRTARLVRWHLEQGAEAFMVGSEAGEYQALAINERNRLLEYVHREALGKAVYTNISGDTTNASMALAQDANEWGSAGAVLMPPLSSRLTEAEASHYLQVVRRHGQLPIGFIDPVGIHAALSDVESEGVSTPKLLVSKNFGHFALTKGSAHECWTAAGLVHPVALFGVRRGLHILNKWDTFQPLIEGLLKAGGPHRVGKYVMQELGVDVGSPRGPYGPLDGQARELADKVIQLTGGLA